MQYIKYSLIFDEITYLESHQTQPLDVKPNDVVRFDNCDLLDKLNISDEKID